MKIAKYSFGIGDRFGHQGKAQLQALIRARQAGINVTPVWNKSHREHGIVGTTHADVRKEADEAVAALNWTDPFHVDADHINLGTVDGYVPHADFFTIDVADYINERAEDARIQTFVQHNQRYLGELSIPGISESYNITEQDMLSIAGKYLYATQQAGEIYRHICTLKGNDDFIPEVSMDEVDDPQTPVELFFILNALAAEKIPVQTIAPKFTGRFNKGVDYEGDIGAFEKEFEQDLLVIDYAISEFDLPENLKLSVHSGSDKFSIYPIMGKLVRKYDKGLHVKTAGTTWLEEVIGLAVAGGEGLDLAREIYRKAFEKQEELCKPYAAVIDIDYARLPAPDAVDGWDSEQFANTLRHIPGHADYDMNFRQLIHVGYKVAAEMGDRYTGLLEKHAEVVGKQVEENIFDRHLKRLFDI